MSDILIYTTQFCGYCRAAKNLLSAKALKFAEIDVGFDADKRIEMVERAGGLRTVPQVFINGRHVGGYDELAALEREGKLDAWLADALAPQTPASQTQVLQTLASQTFADASET